MSSLLKKKPATVMPLSFVKHAAPEGLTKSNDSDSYSWVLRRTCDSDEPCALRQQRAQIARDLHDGIGSQLTHIISRLEVMAHKNKGMEEGLITLRDFASETIRQLRETIWVLNQDHISFGHLSERIRGLISRLSDDYEETKIQLAVQGDKAIDISPSAASSLFRIIQEGVNNALKYAHASTITVCLNADYREITIQISDDGCGFSLKDVKMGYGLQNMRHRAEEMAGQFYVHSSEKGSHIMVSISVQS